MADDAASHYDFNHHLYGSSNRKVPGFFKDELNSVPMQEFVGCIQNAMPFSVSRIYKLFTVQ